MPCRLPGGRGAENSSAPLFASCTRTTPGVHARDEAARERDVGERPAAEVDRARRSAPEVAHLDARLIVTRIRVVCDPVAGQREDVRDRLLVRGAANSCVSPPPLRSPANSRSAAKSCSLVVPNSERASTKRLGDSSNDTLEKKEFEPPGNERMRPLLSVRKPLGPNERIR